MFHTESLLNSTTLRADLSAFFAGASDTAISREVDELQSPYFHLELAHYRRGLADGVHSLALGIELIKNRWSDASYLSTNVASERQKLCSTDFVKLPTNTSTCESLRIWDVARSFSDERSWMTAPDLHTISRDFSGIGHDVMCGSVAALVDDAINYIEKGCAQGSSTACSTACESSCADFAPDPDLSGTNIQCAFDVGHSCCSGSAPTDDGKSIGAASDSNLPIFRAGIDSCCTATCTESLARLVNVRRCNEEFRVADGKTSAICVHGDRRHAGVCQKRRRKALPYYLQERKVRPRFQVYPDLSHSDLGRAKDPRLVRRC